MERETVLDGRMFFFSDANHSHYDYLHLKKPTLAWR